MIFKKKNVTVNFYDLVGFGGGGGVRTSLKIKRPRHYFLLEQSLKSAYEIDSRKGEC